MDKQISEKSFRRLDIDLNQAVVKEPIELAQQKKYLVSTAARDQAIEKITRDYSDLKKKYDNLCFTVSQDDSSLKSQIADLITENNELKKDLTLQKERLSASFSSNELADYLKEAITAFNDKMSDKTGTATYAITNMEVNLKAQITKKNDKLGFVTTTNSGESALSDVKITIGAVPRV